MASGAPWEQLGSAPEQHNSLVGGKVRKEAFYIPTTEMRQTENSTDLDMGRRPELKSVECSVSHIS